MDPKDHPQGHQREPYQRPREVGVADLSPGEAIETGAQEIRALCEQCVEVGAGALDAEAHGRGLGGHTELVEQSDEVGIAGFVEDNESGVHRQRVTFRVAESHGGETRRLVAARLTKDLQFETIKSFLLLA